MSSHTYTHKYLKQNLYKSNTLQNVMGSDVLSLNCSYYLKILGVTHEIDFKACRWSAVVHKSGLPSGDNEYKDAPLPLPASRFSLHLGCFWKLT